MHRLTAWFTKNPVAANLLMILFLAAGYFTVETIRIEGFPSLPPSAITITTIYPGANAEQVDRSITRKIENVLKGMNGIKKIRSESFAEMSSIWIQKTSDMDIDRFQNEIKTRIDAIYNMPQLAEKSVIAREEFTISALLLQIYGETDEITLQKSAKLVKQRLLDHPKISKLQLFGLKEHEIRIELNEERLNSLGLSLYEVAEKINNSSLDYKTGQIKSENGTILIRSDKKAFQFEDFLQIPVLTPESGSRILLKDVAQIVDDFEEIEGFAKFQGLPSVGFLVYTSSKGHLIEVSEAVREVITKLKIELPSDIKLDIWGESSIYMKNRLNLLATNAWQGLILVFILLALFLNVRLAFWVAMGIPISVAGALTVMGERFLNYSLNDITTFGLILVLGILVDDAVVVGESVFEERSKTKDRFEGTIKGVGKVATATIFGAFTTIAAFYPMLMINNDIAKAFASFAVVVIVSLLVSLVESKFILPAHLAAIKQIDIESKNKLSKWWKNIQTKAASFLDYIVVNVYKPLATKTINHKFSSLVIFISLAVIGISMIFNGQVRTVFFPQVPGQIITVNLKMNSGSPLKLTMENLDKIEKTAEELNTQIMKEYDTDNPPIAKILVALNDSYDAEIYAELQPNEKRVINTMEVLELWRSKTGVLEGTEKLDFSGTFETGGGFVLELIAPDRKVLEEASLELKEMLANVGGVYDISDNLSVGTPQLRLHLRPEAEHLRFDVNILAAQIGDAFGGLEIQRIQRDLDDVKIKVNYERNNRKYIKDLLNSRIQNKSGQWIPLTLIADIKLESTDASISRNNGLLTTEIKANLDKNVTGADLVFSYAKHFHETELSKRYPGLELKAGGELEEITELKGGMRGAFVIIILLIFSLLAIPLKSYWQPLVIMSVVPFGFVGAVFGHLISGYPLSLLSFFGMLAVMGVVVNDSLLMMTRFNELLTSGISVKEALIKAGESRFRAIFLTTVTTVSGLLPLLLETSEQAQYLIPAAISLAYGVMFATIVTLFVVPMILSIAYGFKSEKKPINSPVQVSEI